MGDLESASEKKSGSMAPAGTDEQGHRARVEVLHASRMDLALHSSIEFRIPPGRKTYTGKMVGFEQYEFLIARIPYLQSLKGKLVPGAMVLAKFEAAGKAYAFTSSILQFYTRPAPLMIVAYPETVTRLEMRREARTACRLPLTLHRDARVSHGMLLDISSGGGRLEIAYPSRNDVEGVRPGVTVFIQIGLFSGDKYLVTGEVRQVDKRLDSIRLGVRFIDPPNEFRREVLEYMARAAGLKPAGKRAEPVPEARSGG